MSVVDMTVFWIFGVATVASFVMGTSIRREVNQKLPDDARFKASFWWGVFYGLRFLKLHRQYYPASRIRVWYGVAAVATLSSFLFLVVHQALTR